jgi:hypothetical protein
MKFRTISLLTLTVCGLLGLTTFISRAQEQKSGAIFTPVIPKTSDDEAMASLEVPLADPVGSPKHVSADYYYRIPIRPIYKSYPFYAPGREPVGYVDWLKPQVIWDDAGHRPTLQTEADWIKAGEIVFDAPLEYFPLLSDSEWRALFQSVVPPVAKDGTIPVFHLFVRKRGEVELGNFACGVCHTRVLPEGPVLKGAQGNFPLERTGALQAPRCRCSSKR